MNKEKLGSFRIEFGKNLKKLRKERKLSLRKLAQQCNVDHSDINKIEKGLVNITIDTLADLAKGLGAHPKQLSDFVFDDEA